MGAIHTPRLDEPLTFDFAPLRRRRRELEISQRKLAAMAGTHEHAVHRWESGLVHPSLMDIVVVARILGTPIRDLFTITDRSTGELVELRRRR